MLDAALAACTARLADGFTGVVLTSRREFSAAGRKLLATAGARVGAAAAPQYVHMTPYTFSGLLIFFSLAMGVALSICCVASIQTPRHFPINPPAVGKQY